MLMNIGIEVEFTNVERSTLGILLAEKLNSKFEMSESGIGRFNFIYGDLTGYSLTRDRSVQSYRKGTPFGDIEYEFSNELITKVIDIENNNELDTFKTTLDIIKENGGMVNDTCGLHVHIDQPDLDTTKHILKVIHSAQYLQLGINQNRLDKYCKPIPDALIANLDSVSSLKELKELWLTVDGSDDIHDIKYYMVNIDQNRTLEFRWFNATLDYENIINGIHALLSLIDPPQLITK